jgi:hypothetical protein
MIGASNQEAFMGPFFLVLVVAGFALFIVVFGAVSVQECLHAGRQARSARKASIPAEVSLPTASRAR